MKIDEKREKKSISKIKTKQKTLCKQLCTVTMVITFVGHGRRSISRYTRGTVSSLTPRRRSAIFKDHRLRQQHLLLLSKGSRRMSTSSSSSQPPYYDSHGDYQADNDSGNFSQSKESPLYKEQDCLPHLPVNSIVDTIERLKPSCLALVSNQNNNKERTEFLRACNEFPEQAKALQQRLEDRAKTEDNWLQSWWNKIGYLGVRDPSPINVNYIFNFPKATKNTDYGRVNPIERGAKLLHSVYAFSELVRSGDLPQDRFGKQQTPLCSSMYKYMFYSCRIPKEDQDLYRIYNYKYYNEDKSPMITPKHAVVSAGGHYFSVDLVDPSDGRPYSVRELELALQECVARALSLDETSGADLWRNLGILTTANRDEWALNRTFLVENVRGMKNAMNQLESGLVLLCLESSEGSAADHHDTAIDSLSQNSRTYLMGTQGRWYDKSLQFIMTPTGNIGLNGEHSMMDGMPAVRLQDFILKHEAVEESGNDKLTKGQESLLPVVKPIFASPTILEHTRDTERGAIESMKDKASFDFDTTTNSLDLEVQSFRGYGAEWIKKHAKCSPDAFVQMSIQLAMGKLSTTLDIASSGGNSANYVPMATYESTQVRPFQYGRTETTRSVSTQSVAWVEAMLNRKCSAFGKESQSLKDLFHKATDAHVDYIRQASKGLGVDRHLFGLQMILAEHQGEKGAGSDGILPTLFRDPLFVRSKQWLVSTSTLPSNPGFGPVVVPEGVGIAYDVKADHVYFTCTSYKGSAPALSHYLEESLLEMRELIMSAEGHGQSKL